MSLLDKLERRFGWCAIPNLTMLLTCAQATGFALIWAKLTTWDNMALVMSEVAEGQVWRLGTFLFLPATMSPIWLFFALYLFYLMGSTLEAHWGEFRYNLFLAIAYLATVAAACVAPHEPATNVYLGGSVFLAFAYLFPNFELLIFFILPVKIKWLALLQWIGYFLSFTMGDWMQKAMVLAAVSNFLLFFGKDIFRGARDGKRRMEWNARHLAKRDKPFHNCAICGANERTHPKMDFRYCTKCSGSYEYCAEHLPTHEHVVKQTAAAPAAGGEEADVQA
ncbi:MAG TPA: hypothetical protein VFI31_09655 [Pirellulales bacterium]|nr:hypothetical protein [Pirellulales bacterium]